MLDSNTSLVIATAQATLAGLADGYRQNGAYYEGKQRVRYATEKYRNEFAHLFDALALNMCRGVVDILSDRLQVDGFSVAKGRAAVADDAWAIWQANRMDIRSGVVHKGALMKGDAYAIVWPGADGQPVISPNDASTVTVGHDPDIPGRVIWAVKTWAERVTDGTRLGWQQRVTVYFPDRIEKYAAPASDADTGLTPARVKALTEFTVSGEPWPLPNPWGVVPVFHFANDPSEAFGQSEIGPILSVQDALNKTVYDLMVTMEFSAYRQRWATGLEVEINEDTGKPIQPFEPGQDRLWTSAAPDARFGEFSTADLKGFLDVKQSFKLDIAQISATPLHYLALQSDPPSGEALKTLESRFVRKAQDRQAAFGAQWEMLMQLALQMAGKAPASARLTAHWADAASKSEKLEWETLLLKQTVGVDTQTLLEEGGYGKEDAARMAASRAQENALAAASAAQKIDQTIASRDATRGASADDN